MSTDKTLLQPGDVFTLTHEHTVYTDLPEHFVYANRRGSWKLTHSHANLSKHTWLQGRYVVTRTTMDGGGTGHGPHDVYHDGHHVWAEKVDGSVQVDFYQTGSFTALNSGIPVEGKARQTWTIDQDTP